MKKYLSLFFTMLKIGLFTFGGGYAMIALLENEFIEKKNYIDKDEFLDMVAIAEQNVFCILTMDWYLLHTTTTKHFMKFQIKEQTYVSI